MTVTISGTTPGIAVDGTGAVVNVTVTTGAGGGGGVELGETSTTAYRGDRGKTAYDHSQVTTGNPHGTTASDVGADPAGTAAGLVDDLSGVSNQATARTNLGLGTAATAATGDFAAASHTHTGTQVTVDASGFNGNLATTDDTVQLVAQKLDDLTPSSLGAQPVDADLTTIAGLTATTDSFIQSKSSAWAARTVSQVRTDLGVGGWSDAQVNPAVGDWWGTPFVGGLYNAGTGVGNLFFIPFWVPSGVSTVDTITVEVTSTTATAVVRLGLYLPASDRRPGTLLVDGGTADASSAAVVSVSLGSPPTVTPHSLIYVAVCSQTASPTYRMCSNAYLLKAAPIPSSTASHLFVRTDTTAWRETGVTGGLPSTATPARVAAVDCTPLVALRRAS